MKNLATDNDRNAVASLRDIRPASPRIELASQSSIDILAALAKHPLVACAVVVLCLAAGYQLYLRKTPRDFTAQAAVYVSPTYFKNLEQNREQLQISYSTLVNQQILTIRRFDILQESIKRLQKQGIEWRDPNESEAAAVMRLARMLDLQHVPDSYEVVIGLSGPRREWLAPIVNTVTDTYIEKGKQEELADRSTQLDALRSEQGRIADDLQKRLDQQAELAQKMGTVAIDKAAASDDALLGQTRQARAEAHTRRVEAETQLQVISGASGSGPSLLTAIVQDAATSTPSARPQIDSLIQRQVDVQKNIAGMTPQHPLRQAAQNELTELNDQLAALRSGLTKDASTVLITKLQGDIDRNALLERQLDKEIDTISYRLQSVAKDIQLSQGVNAEIDRLRRLHTQVTGQIDDLSMPSNNSSYLRVFSAAQPPLEANQSSSRKRLVIVLGIALFLGLAAAGAMDLIDQRIVSPYDVKRSVGFPPVGIVLEPRGLPFAEEHFRRLVNGIQRGVTTQGAKTIVLTPLRYSRTPGFLVNDIARVLCSRGIKTAIVDANPHRLEEAEAAVAPSNGILSLSASLQPRAQNGSDARLPTRINVSSPTDVSPTPLISRVGGLLSEMEREYDVVLIDAPPLAVSADTEFLASICDITLLVAETGRATRGELIRGASLLGRIGAPSVGVIMSEVNLPKAGGALRQEYKRFRLLAPPTQTSESLNSPA